MNIRGALIEMMEYNDEQEKVLKCYNAFLELKCSKMIILRELDADKYLVAICRDTPQFNWELMWTINESIYVNTKSFYSIDKRICRMSESRFLNPSKVVEEIYHIHNLWLAKQRKRTRTTKKKKHKKNEIKLKKIDDMTIRKTYGSMEPPKHLKWAAKHPYQGGRFSEK